MKEIVRYQIDDKVKIYGSQVGTVILIHKIVGTEFSEYQRVWIRLPNGNIMDTSAENLQPVSDKPSSKDDCR
jgi:6-phosphogluconate dehydrogenase (decarboxylating)